VNASAFLWGSTNAAARHPRLQTKSPLDHEQSPKPNDEAYFLAEYAYANIACKYQPGHQTHVKTQHSKKSPAETTEIMHNKRSIHCIKNLICIDIKACNGMALNSHSKQY
jgi:hypothetical protein